MTIWLLPLALLVFTTLCAIPLSRYLAWIMDGKYRAPKLLRWFEERLDTGPQDWKRYTAALLIFNGVMFVFGYLVLALQPIYAVEPARARPVVADGHFQCGRLLHHEHEPPALFGRPAFLQLQPGVLRHLQSVHFRRGGVLRADGDHPRLPRREDRRQLLPRHVARGGLYVPAGRLHPRRHLHQPGHADDAPERVPGLDAGGRGDGHGRQGPGEAADHRGRPGRGRHPDQDARHERRRILRHERRPPVRESHGPDQLRDDVCHDAVPVRAGADVRPDARPVAARRGDLRGDDAHDDRHDRLGDPLRHAEAEPRVDRASGRTKPTRSPAPRRRAENAS